LLSKRVVPGAALDPQPKRTIRFITVNTRVKGMSLHLRPAAPPRAWGAHANACGNPAQANHDSTNPAEIDGVVVASLSVGTEGKPSSLETRKVASVRAAPRAGSTRSSFPQARPAF
jgi:hypothetical protein